MIARWEEGRAAVDQLLKDGRIDFVQPSRDLALEWLGTSERHLRSAGLIREVDPEGAFSLTYDAARFALAAILVNQGLRAKSGDGAHAVLLDVVRAQVPPPAGRIFEKFGWIRRRRNDTQYPDADRPAANLEDLDEATPDVVKIVAAARKLVDNMPPYGKR